MAAVDSAAVVGPADARECRVPVPSHAWRAARPDCRWTALLAAGAQRAAAGARAHRPCTQPHCCHPLAPHRCPAPAAAPAPQRRLLLITTVDIGGGASDRIEVHEGDAPEALAADFVARHGLPDGIVPALAAHLEDNIRDAAEAAAAAARSSAGGGAAAALRSKVRGHAA